MVPARSKARPPVLSVIIVNYNVRDFLSQAIQAIRKSARSIPAEIIVVDNASTDGSVRMLKKEYPDVHLIASKQNLGFARANNLAIQKARGEFVLLINPDTVVQEETFTTMIEFFRQRPDVGLAGCKVLNPDGSFQLSCRRGFPSPWNSFCKLSGLSSLFPRSRIFGGYNLTYLDPDAPVELDAISGAFMFARATALKQVGGLDERFFMYGEDLDWCYRFRQKGWGVYYLPTTSIIHFKGESTRRSGMDEVSAFYEAMNLFVDKHLSDSLLFKVLLHTGIRVSRAFARIRKWFIHFRMAFVDIVLVNMSIALAETLWLGSLWSLPAYAYPFVFTIPGLVVAFMLYLFGAYTERKHSTVYSFFAVVVSYLLLSASVAFFKEFAFSRVVLALSGVFSLLFIPGWRLLYRSIFRSALRERGALFSRRTLIVGTDEASLIVLAKLRQRLNQGYHVIGLLDLDGSQYGKTIEGVPVLGSAENVSKVITDQRVTDVIFPAQAISYADILRIIANSRTESAQFHLVPDSMDMMIGKASIDTLDEMPLVEISYNIDKPDHQLLKRLFDLFAALPLLFTLYPFALLASFFFGGKSKLLLLPKIVWGSMSFVGPAPAVSKQGESPAPYLGKPGMVSIIGAKGESGLGDEDIAQYNMYYAKNQSLSLDIEILLRSLFKSR